MEKQNHFVKEDCKADKSTCVLPDSGVEILNNDCLFRIFSYLSIKLQLKLMRVCPRFEEVIENIFYTCKSLNFNNLKDCTDTEINDFFQRIGIRIKSVICDSDSDKRHIQILPHVFPNLECLNLDGIYLHRFHPQLLTSNISTNLISLALTDCGIDDNDCSAIKHYTKLQHLDLSYNNKISGKHLNLIQNLKTLKLSYCENIESTEFIALCEVCKLTELYINSCHSLNNKSLEVLLNTQTNLDILGISNTYEADNLNIVTKLPNLRHLIIISFMKISDDFLCELVKYKREYLQVLTLIWRVLDQNQKDKILMLTRLEELNITVEDRFLAELSIRSPNLKKLGCFSNSELSREALISYILKAKNLETIGVPYCADYYGVSFISNLVHALHTANRSKPIHVMLRRGPEKHPKLDLRGTQDVLRLSHGWKN